jgi:hypothetical protein
MTARSDPTKEPEFQKVIRHFVTTPHRPHDSLNAEHKHSGEDKANPQKKRARPAKDSAAR